MNFQRADLKIAIYAGIYILICWIFYALLGFISFEHPQDSYHARDAGAAITLPVIVSLCIFGQHIVLRRNSYQIAKLMSYRRRKTPAELSSQIKSIVEHHIKKRMVWLAILAMIIVAVYFMHVSVEIDPSFRFNPIIDFDLKRSPISVLFDQIEHFSEISDRNAETTFFF
ncbi:hypothetical protein PN836_002810 [Ningiella sp. W23]|uniref:hypothetical protein n=1 Tax=Ningiella sp. W23 TaxID=3023715 RepID=UPI003757BA13